jgi:hypothetical protein
MFASILLAQTYNLTEPRVRVEGQPKNIAGGCRHRDRKTEEREFGAISAIIHSQTVLRTSWFACMSLMHH